MRCILLASCLALVPVSNLSAFEASTSVTEKQIASALQRAGKNRDQIKGALAAASKEHRRATRFLIAYMPDRDLRSLSADYIENNVRIAYLAKKTTPWGETIPEALFFNDVLPYASVNERRDDWRADFYRRFLPLVKQCQTPTEAAQILNRDMFKLLDVKYHARKRPKPDQSPFESIEAKYASCTGLSILLIDACRAVCIPARFAGTPQWAKKRGNHSWVEIWDGDWHFTGACEYNAGGVNKTWFQGDASHAIKDDPLRAIYASSWRSTGSSFPLVWDLRDKEVAAVNVTDRYVLTQATVPDGKVMVTIEVYGPNGERIVSDVTLSTANKTPNRVKSKGQGDDTNNRLELNLDPNTDYSIRVEFEGDAMIYPFRTSDEQRQLAKIVFAPAQKAKPSGKLSPIESLQQILDLPRDKRPDLTKQPFSRVPLTRAQAKRAADLLWQDHAADLRKSRAEEMKSKLIKIGDKVLKFDYKIFGQQPDNGRSLFISLHGGGGAPARVNDQQWENQKRLYQPKEGIYLAPRAPTDTWNLWHQGHIDPLFERLIEDLIVFENVDPNRIYVMGYSAGGDGVYQLAPRMADRWAAAAMMAGHPNDASPLGLRNLGFALHMGARDGAYKRNEVAAAWKARLAELRQQDPGGYRHQAVIHEGKGHWMDRQDAIAVPWMADFTRNPFPQRIVWKQDDVTHSRFYWLAVDQPKAGAMIRADVVGQTIDLDSEDVAEVNVLLSDELLDLDQPITIKLNGKRVFHGKIDRSIANIVTSLAQQPDPAAVYSATKLVGANRTDPAN